MIELSGGAGEDDFPYGDWTAPYRTPEGFAMVTAMYGETFDLLLGRRTYDGFSTFWPKAPKSPMADRLNAATKYVVTHRPGSLEWGPFEGIGPDLVQSVRGIKAKDGKDLILSGSSTLTSALLEHGLAERSSYSSRSIHIGYQCAQGLRLASFLRPYQFRLQSFFLSRKRCSIRFSPQSCQISYLSSLIRGGSFSYGSDIGLGISG